MIANIRPSNLCIPVAVFASVWQRVEKLGERPAETPTGDHYLSGVVGTCRWLYGGPVPDLWKRMVLPEAPFTHYQHAAMPETIDAEYLKAVACRPDSYPTTLDLARGVADTLAWCWNGTGRAPLEEPTAAPD
jgi:hypothetical protein